MIKQVMCPSCRRSELRYVPDTTIDVGTSRESWVITCGTCHHKFDVVRPKPFDTKHVDKSAGFD